MKYLDKWLTVFMNKIPDKLIGKSKEYEKELYLLYGNTQNNNIVFSMRLKNIKRYLCIITVFIFIIILAFFSCIFNSNDIFSIDKAGRKYIERPDYDQGTVSAKLVVAGEVDGEKVKKQVILNIKPEGTNENKENVKEKSVDLKGEVIGKINSVIYSINKSDDDKAVYLPEEIEGMKHVLWSAEKNNPILLATLIFGVLLIGTYFKRYDEIKKLKRKCNESIEAELPDFLNKMVLLMNAGLVLSAAFEKIVSDYNSRAYREKSYFYNQLTEISIKVNETNAPMIHELKKFAERSKNREFMRISNVIADNVHKGTELVNILQSESGFLWFQRKKRAEEKGRIAETKLTMPLALQLLVLIMITLAPAIIEM